MTDVIDLTWIKTWADLRKFKEVQREHNTGLDKGTIKLNKNLLKIISSQMNMRDGVDGYKIYKKPKKTLSDKAILNVECPAPTFYEPNPPEEIKYITYSEKDVQEAIKDYLISVQFRPNPSNMVQLLEDARRIFGDRLVK